jgi:hypothetical protein
MEELTQVVIQFTSNLLPDSLQDIPSSDLSELGNESKSELLLEPPRSSIDLVEELSESTSELIPDLPAELLDGEAPSETSSDSPLEAPTAELSESNDELLLESPADISERTGESTDKLLPKSLTQTQLARRLDVPKTTLGSAKKRPDFSQWSRERDLDTIGWRWNVETKVFTPIVDDL